MGLFSFLKKNNSSEAAAPKTGGMEDFMSLFRVYYQSAMAAQLGISNLAALPDLRIFKQTFKVQTVNNRLGIGEKKKCKQLMMELYKIPEFFFSEIDASLKRNCKNINVMQSYLYSFQAFTQELMIVSSNLMKWKFRTPGFLKGLLHSFTQKTISDIMTKPYFKDAAVQKSVVSVRKLAAQLDYSEAWMTEFVYHVLILAKKEPRPEDVSQKK